MDFFLTAYDPSDLPGNSVDPLGFDRGYLYWADQFLPGLTNAANHPRYYSVLCAGISLAPDTTEMKPRESYRTKLEALKRLERFWAIANVLASRAQVEGEELSSSGIRGVTYAETKVNDIRVFAKLNPPALQSS